MYYGEICGGASNQTKDGSPEPNRRRKQWIGGVGLKKVFRRGVRGVRAGVRGGLRECSAPIEIRRNRKETQKSLFFEVTLKRYPRRCPQQFLSFEFLYTKDCIIIIISSSIHYYIIVVIIEKAFFVYKVLKPRARKAHDH